MAGLTAHKIIFDLDGTLVDTAPDLTAAMNHVLNTIDRPSVAEEHVRHMVGHGARKMLETGLDFTGGRDDHDLAALHQAFLRFYADNIAVSSTPYSGCEAMLQRLSDAGILMAICTNKPIGLALPLLEKLNITHYFNCIKGGDSFAFKKPDGRHIIHTAAELTGDGDIIMVGDSITDIKAAQSANVPSIAVTFGYSDPPAATLGADYTVDCLSEIPTLLGL